MWAEVSDQVGSAAWNRFAPVSGVSRKGVFLEGVDFVANEAGNHGCLLLMYRHNSLLIRKYASVTVEA
jgi:hypothetical protein